MGCCVVSMGLLRVGISCLVNGVHEGHEGNLLFSDFGRGEGLTETLLSEGFGLRVAVADGLFETG